MSPRPPWVPKAPQKLARAPGTPRVPRPRPPPNPSNGTSQAGGGGLRLAYKLMMTKVHHYAKILYVLQLSCWSWYSDQVANVQTPEQCMKDALASTQGKWMEDSHLSPSLSVALRLSLSLYLSLYPSLSPCKHFFATTITATTTTNYEY